MDIDKSTQDSSASGGGGSKWIVIGGVALVGAIICGAIALAGRSKEAPVTTTQQVTSPSLDVNAATAQANSQPLSASQSSAQAQPESADAASAMREPNAPVPPNKIEGSWWAETPEEERVYAFVEKVDISPVDARGNNTWIWTLSTQAPKWSMILTCSLTKPALTEEDYEHLQREDRVKEAERTRWGHCDHSLPALTWVRITTGGGLLHSPQAPTTVFGIHYKHSSESDFVSQYKVEAICDSSNRCVTWEQHQAKAEAALRESKRRGEN